MHVEYSGPPPDIGGYPPINTEGSILLGTGGGDSNGSDGSFFEGVATAGYPSAGTDSAVQATIVVAGYQAVTPAFPAAGTDYTITNVGNGMVLEAEDCEVANGTVVRQWAQLGVVCQQ